MQVLTETEARQRQIEKWREEIARLENLIQQYEAMMEAECDNAN